MVKNTQDTHRSEGRGTAQGIPAGVRLSEVLQKLVDATANTTSLKQSKDEIRAAGITAQDLQGVIAYLTYLRPPDLGAGFGRKAYQDTSALQQRFDEVLTELRFLVSVADVPGFSSEGNKEAALTVNKAQNTLGARVATAGIRTALAEILAPIYGFTNTVMTQILANSTGKVGVPAGSDRELHWTIDVILPDGSKKTFSGVVENTAGLTGRFNWNGGIEVERLIGANNPQQ